ncbi:outer membrane protein-like protein iml2 [Calycina marina]|uniref:Inclusion body clearance protein IML2 n=1 Tax=Calycina marina TaxID=1763456 RepID=A0A9P8CB32_9HELO|nr:outer membrane protein-like protein iml2 [Calycina marina]
MRLFRSTGKAKPMIAAEEDVHLQSVETALLKLLNDDIAAANAILQKSNSSYHHLGRGISSFISAILGAEKELLKDAAAALHLAETKTWEDMKAAQKDTTAYQSKIYAPGTEYHLCYAISQLTSAITAVMSGSVTEAIKGFYKLRKAYLTLNGILEAEKMYLRRMAGYREVPIMASIQEDEEDKPVPVVISGNDETVENGGLDEKLPTAIRTHSRASIFPTNALPGASRVRSNLLEQDPADLGITTHTDIFIHSGVRLCYGILLLVFSMIENPLFTRILYIVGVKGDRERGTRYLWEAARFDNFNSAIAGILLLDYYNGLIGICDILPTDSEAEEDLQGFPRVKCRALLIDMRKRYPDSRLWKLEEARIHGYDRNLSAGIDILKHNADSNMKQIVNINIFELGLSSMCAFEYELCANTWIQCAEMGSWSPCLYAYIIGIAYLEMYRDLRCSEPDRAKEYKDKATDYIRKGPPLVGKQKLMGKELPFDVFIARRLKKWEANATELGVDLVDAIGVSPIAEQAFLWNGFKKQSVKEMNKTLLLLDWSRTCQPEKLSADANEAVLCALLRSSIYRNLKDLPKCREILVSEVLNHDKNEFKASPKDDWLVPYSQYEMAALCWAEKDQHAAYHAAKVKETEKWLNNLQTMAAEPYTLDTRMSFKLTTSLLTIKRHKEIMKL